MLKTNNFHKLAATNIIYGTIKTISMKKYLILLLLPLLFESCQTVRYLFPNGQREYILEMDSAQIGIGGYYTVPGGVDLNFHFYNSCFSINPDLLRIGFRDDDINILHGPGFGCNNDGRKEVPQDSEFIFFDGDTLVVRFDIRPKGHRFIGRKRIDGLIRFLPSSFITYDGQPVIADTITFH